MKKEDKTIKNVMWVLAVYFIAAILIKSINSTIGKTTTIIFLILFSWYFVYKGMNKICNKNKKEEIK